LPFTVLDSHTTWKTTFLFPPVFGKENDPAGFDVAVIQLSDDLAGPLKKHVCLIVAGSFYIVNRIYDYLVYNLKN